MYVINIYLRLGLIAVFLLGGIALAFAYGFWYSFPLILIGIILLTGYLLLGTVQSAAMLMQEADITKAEQRLNLTLSPKLLYATNRAYYYMLKGTIAVGKKDIEEGEMWLEKARAIDVPTDNEKAMIELQLANIHASKNKWKQAKVHFRAAKQLKITDPNIKEQLKQFEKALNNSGQLKAAGRMGGQKGSGVMRPGGKRRRPKMR